MAGAEGFEPPSSVLETDSLAVELTPLCPRLLRFAVDRVFPALAAELAELEPLGRGFAVLCGRIILIFTICALKLANFAGHLNPSFSECLTVWP